MLPPDFELKQRVGFHGLEHMAWLQIGQKCVAQIDKRLDGSWFTTVNRHRPPRMWLKTTCGSPEQGRRWVERWACAHADRLRREPDGFANPRAWEPPED
jgi:hypothetical protein